MKKIHLLTLALILCAINPTLSIAQSWSLSGNTITTGQYLGVNNNVVLEFRRNANTVLAFDENDNIKLGRNNSISLDFSNSVAIGNNIEFYNQDQINNTFALGTNIFDYGSASPYYVGTTLVSPTASITIGSGINSSNKLMGPGDGLSVGFNSNVPTLYVGASIGISGSTGNVGIATTNPLQKLDVNGGIKLGNTTVASNGSLRYNNNDFEGYANGAWISLTNTGGSEWAKNGNKLYSLNTGDVGIGTSTPENAEGWDKSFNVNGNQHSQIIATTTVGGIKAGLWSHSSGFYTALTGGITGTKSNHPFSIITNGTSRITVATNGNVGIGITNPTEKLELNGALRMNGSKIYFIAGTSDPYYYINGGAWNTGMEYQHFGGHRFLTNYNIERMRIMDDGKVIIGDVVNLTTPGNYKLYVQDGILAEKVKVAVKNTSNWADYVFAINYKLMPLSTLEKFVQENKHLPEVPSAEEVVKNGIDMAQMDAILLKKVEELTLYIIEQNKRIEKLEEENRNLKR